MKTVVIIDDESVVRLRLRTIIKWEEHGYRIIEDFMNPIMAVEYLQQNKVDLVFTDMKMPEMTGIQLLERLKEEEKVPIVVVLSAYNEFDMVREAFRLGAFDYLLKGDLLPENISELLHKITEIHLVDDIVQSNVSATTLLQEKHDEFEDGDYILVSFEVNDYKKLMIKFGTNIEEELQKPMLELARQVQRIASKGIIESIYPSQYIMYYRVSNGEQSKKYVISVVKQLLAVWNTYMNVVVSAAISGVVQKDKWQETIEENSDLLKIGVLEGKGSITNYEDSFEMVESYKLKKKQYELLVSSLYMADEIMFTKEKDKLLYVLNTLSIKDAKEEVLLIVVYIAEKFKYEGEVFFSIFQEEVNYYEKFNRLENLKSIERWCNNYFSWIINYLLNRHESRQEGVLLRAKRFILDNYASPELNLQSVADYVGLNPKYLSSRFTKEIGVTFSSYLIEIRITKAKKLLKTTNLKIYEISERVGYNNVEHFNRIFKRECEISPSDFRDL